ncbi:MAG: hypothetical protein R6V01_04525 [Thermoplasmatota archaeon]
MKPYHPIGYNIHIKEPDDENPEPEYYLEFEEGEPVPEELVHGKEVEVQIDDVFQIFGHYKHPYLNFEGSEPDMEKLKEHTPKEVTIWY